MSGLPSERVGAPSFFLPFQKSRLKQQLAIEGYQEENRTFPNHSDSEDSDGSTWVSGAQRSPTGDNLSPPRIPASLEVDERGHESK